MIRVSATASANLAGSPAKPGAMIRITAGMKISPTRTKSEQRREQHRERILGKGAGGVLAVLGHGAGEQRHEGGAEGALGEQAAEQVRQALRDEERVRHRPGAEQAPRSGCRGQSP